MENQNHLRILGIRGIPAEHGGFETFAERLALFLVKNNWKVTVYCHTENEPYHETQWQGINLVKISTPKQNAFWSIYFDLKSTLHALKSKDKSKDIVLTLGYNTAILLLLYRLKGILNVINMDGLEWKRKKWKALEKAWLFFNEKFGIVFSDHMIADHPNIKKYLTRYANPNKITMIPYGSYPVNEKDFVIIKFFDLIPNEYALVIARAEPENSILEIVSAFSKKKRGIKLVILGNYKPKECPYHQQVIEAASDEVVFLGAIYNKKIVQSLRCFAKLYIHGHTVGGTNPSLVEALAAGNPVLAHDNPFNCWVAGEDAHYFKDEIDCAEKLDKIIENSSEVEKMKLGSIQRYQEEFCDDKDLKAYEKLLLRLIQEKNIKNTVYCTKSEISQTL